MNEVKVLFRDYSDVLDEIVVETLWAKTVDSESGIYQIENVPFYVKTAFLNLIYAEFDSIENALVFRHNVKESGNSTVQVIILKKDIPIDLIRGILENKGCDSESLNDRFFVLDIPANANYTAIQRKLDEFLRQEVIDYAELYLSQIHS